MTSKQELKNRVRQAIDDKADEIVRVSKTILDNPETGFREVKTAKLVADLFGQWGIQHRKGWPSPASRAWSKVGLRGLRWRCWESSIP